MRSGRPPQAHAAGVPLKESQKSAEGLLRPPDRDTLFDRDPPPPPASRPGTAQTDLRSPPPERWHEVSRPPHPAHRVEAHVRAHCQRRETSCRQETIVLGCG